MKKFLMFFAAFGLLFMVSCSSGPESKISKLKDMMEEQVDLNSNKGYKSQESVQHFMETLQYAKEVMAEAANPDNGWTPEQISALKDALNTPIVGISSTMEDVEKDNPALVPEFGDEYGKLWNDFPHFLL